MSLEPAYLALHRTGELAERARRAVSLLGPRCLVCPRACRVDRRENEHSICGVGRYAVVASHFPHFGEEDCLRGRRGSGTIFFGGCNLRCVFCQNFDISWRVGGAAVVPTQLSAMMLELQEAGCHNLNFVTPEHVVPQVLEALVIAAGDGLRLPIVYNTSSFEGEESLRLMDGVVDIYMPDLKLWTAAAARRYLRRPDYPAVARRALVEMNRQVGPLEIGGDGIARRGVLLRHLVMPGMGEETRAILGFIAEALGPGTYVNLLSQYRPAGLVDGTGFPEIARPPSRQEFTEAVVLAKSLGLRLDRRSVRDGALLAAG